MATLAAPAASFDTSEHLVVLIHGLWGNPGHLQFLKDSLRERYSEDHVHILVTERNANSFTYDGIQVGGERVTREIEEKLADLEKDGHSIKRISVIGYSLGGLIARYAIGLLYHKRVFDRIEPINFTTFAAPHLGVRTPLTGALNYIWNILGPRTLSVSGKQLFMVDQFQETGRPLLAVLADPEHIFIKALARFKNRSLYANAVHDRSVTWYTAGISATDPFVDMDAVECNYVKGYEPVVIDGENPVSLKKRERLPLTQLLYRKLFREIPLGIFFVIFIPIGTTALLAGAVVQSFRSSRRIRLHQEGKAGIDVSEYRIPLITEIREGVEEMYENLNNAHDTEYLPSDDSNYARPSKVGAEHKVKSNPDFPTLALTKEQFAMIDALDGVGFKKYPVYIHLHPHSHAAIIKRRAGAGFEEGRIVVKHWLDNFEV
ncbi:lipase/serine esteras-like protein [Westerdykella ornata]|uniref:Lipase/serine esteras-like protein n=1 Tax=Westerdykella ornata TaxID=318751 RepID=A0A6A6JQ20_WESOR|nr:lipase/serine esteras-like protein [Westerdykella ornata]KAF2278740.1 lipase/serine esteras-like protein [Westerdykella ornata]